MIIPNFHRWVQRDTPYWRQSRVYIACWWTPLCYLKKVYNPELARLEREYDCKAERFVWLKRWWRKSCSKT